MGIARMPPRQSRWQQEQASGAGLKMVHSRCSWMLSRPPSLAPELGKKIEIARITRQTQRVNHASKKRSSVSRFGESHSNVPKIVLGGNRCRRTSDRMPTCDGGGSQDQDPGARNTYAGAAAESRGRRRGEEAKGFEGGRTVLQGLPLRSPGFVHPQQSGICIGTAGPV